MDLISLQDNDQNIINLIEYINNITPIQLNLSFENRGQYTYIINDCLISELSYNIIINKLKLTGKKFADKNKRMYNN